MYEKFAYGVDLGWMSQLEALGYSWADDKGEKKDILDILKAYGVDSVRFRLFVNPPEGGFWQKTDTERCMLGYCDAQSVLEVSKRVCKAGFRLMLDLHYSDVFADPAYQVIPEAWNSHSVEQLIEDVREYTHETMKLFRDNNIYPEWVQVGNEINPGMLLPIGDAQKNMSTLAAFLNTGYEAVKDIFPDTKVITHLASGAVRPWIIDWFDAFFQNGGKTDIIGLSHYPYWYKMMEDAEMSDLGENMTEYFKRYDKPVMVVEVGEDEAEEIKSYDLIKQTIDELVSVPNDMGQGIFYWEPEACKDALPDKYPLCAAVLAKEKVIRFNKALLAYIK